MYYMTGILALVFVFGLLCSCAKVLSKCGKNDYDLFKWCEEEDKLMPEENGKEKISFSKSFKIIVAAVLGFAALVGAIIGFDRTYVRVEQATAIAADKANEAKVEVAQTLKSQQKYYETQQQIDGVVLLEMLRCQKTDLQRKIAAEPNNYELKERLENVNTQIKVIEQRVYGDK